MKNIKSKYFSIHKRNYNRYLFFKNFFFTFLYKLLIVLIKIMNLLVFYTYDN